MRLWSAESGIRTLRRWIGESDNIVFFGGAGVSTESGIPDFRGVGGLFSNRHENAEDGASPETILSAAYFHLHPDRFYAFYRKHLVFLAAAPNPAHWALARLEKAGKLRAIVTQNIDGLHQKAGSRKVIELHGSVQRNHCVVCQLAFGIDEAQASQDEKGVPRCGCGGVIRPDVVLYGEDLDTQVMKAAMVAISRADMLIVGGTSLSVYPAAGLIDYYTGHRFVLINGTATPYDDRADLRITDQIGKVFTQIKI
ncbi:MAG TPA: NAD-dependent protein deacylase [Clostridia bacterium]